MLAAALALHLALVQAPAAPAAEPASAAPAVAPAPAPRDEAKAPAPDAEAPKPAAAPTPEEEPLKTDREPPPRTMRTRQRAKSAQSPIPSILSAEPLGGRSAFVGWAGWSALGGGWAMGVTPEDDLGLQGDLDWSTGELHASAFYRRPLGRVGSVDFASRLRAGWYADFGWTWVRAENRGDRGIEFVPGIVLSTRGAGGIFSIAGDLPITITRWRSGGIFAAPKLSVSYETLLYGDLSVGVRVAGAFRAGTTAAPMSDVHSLLELQVLAGWKLF
jgi:hypothetical protein